MLIDAGAETAMNYCSDFTRTFPVNGRFTGRQKDNLFILTDFSLSGYAGDKNLNFIYSGYYFIQKKTN